MVARYERKSGPRIVRWKGLAYVLGVGSWEERPCFGMERWKGLACVFAISKDMAKTSWGGRWSYIAQPAWKPPLNLDPTTAGYRHRFADGRGKGSEGEWVFKP